MQWYGVEENAESCREIIGDQSPFHTGSEILSRKMIETRYMDSSLL